MRPIGMWEVLIMHGAIISEKTGQDFAGYLPKHNGSPGRARQFCQDQNWTCFSTPGGGEPGKARIHPEAVRARMQKMFVIVDVQKD
jgi:hypothetical protein